MDLKLLNNLVAAAKDVYPNQIIMQKVAVTQAIHESGFATKRGGSTLALVYNNLFGIKGEGDLGKIMMPTYEYIDGKAVQVKDWFAHNSDFDASFAQHKHLMSSFRYTRVREANTLKEAFQALRDCGYATDPTYPESLMSVYTTYVAKSFES